MANAQVVLNAGSSSLKFSVFLIEDAPTLLISGQIEGLETHPHFKAKDVNGAVIGERSWSSGTGFGHRAAIEFLFEWGRGALGGLHVVEAGHRVVHGGTRFTGPVRIDAAVLAALDELVPLAPLHQPHSLAAIRAVAEHVPDLPQVACFDTAFHRGQPAVAQLFALPRWLTAEGIRRYGFHGLSYEYVSSAFRQLDPAAAAGRTVVAHLGNGASLCAMHNGRSVATTMSFTPADGLPMGTRAGTLDPGLMTYLMKQHGMNADALENLIYHQSGLLGVSGISSDMRELQASDQAHANEAIELFAYRISRELGSLAAALGGLDALVFTGGIGENDVNIRERVCRSATWLGLTLDPAANASHGPRISRPDGNGVSAWVVPTNEELMIAQHTRRTLG
ncbi:acetate kinase [Singulisphaera sp. GP187]|uniref:acetate/propionate family kinase n=1 Tax=Singulisphaera sp. GP187 TaxID=1882752 RepID=UPI000929AA62|nr:acetate/propionate family kinase [Singulisphaera sp. GP187]SIO60435.1 acetate kinase [Singulisphaera sp. GP187]